MDAQEYINNQFNERLEKLETKVDSMGNKINVAEKDIISTKKGLIPYCIKPIHSICLET